MQTYAEGGNGIKVKIKVERGQVLSDKPRSTPMHNINRIVLLKYNSGESIAQVACYIQKNRTVK